MTVRCCIDVPCSSDIKISHLKRYNSQKCCYYYFSCDCDSDISILFIHSMCIWICALTSTSKSYECDRFFFVLSSNSSNKTTALLYFCFLVLIQHHPRNGSSNFISICALAKCIQFFVLSLNSTDKKFIWFYICVEVFVHSDMNSKCAKGFEKPVHQLCAVCVCVCVCVRALENFKHDPDVRFIFNLQ